MKDIDNICKIALVQAEPVMFDKSASLKKALQYIYEAASQKPDLIVFPELFIPGYPVGMNSVLAWENEAMRGEKTGNDTMMPLLLPEIRSSNNSQRQPKKRRHTSASDFLSETLLVERSTTAMSFLNRTGHIRYTES